MAILCGLAMELHHKKRQGTVILLNLLRKTELVGKKCYDPKFKYHPDLPLHYTYTWIQKNQVVVKQTLLAALK
jgi:hypothetical protein